MAFLLPLLLRALPFIAAAAVAWYGWHRVDNWCNSACVEQRTQLGNARTQLGNAQARATALALLWAGAIEKERIRYVEISRDRENAIAGVRERAGRIRPSTDPVRVRVPADALRVLDDASRLANAEPPAAPAVDQGSPAPVPDPTGADTTLTEWVSFAIEASAAYREAADKHMACVAAYEAARTSIGTINSGD